MLNNREIEQKFEYYLKLESKDKFYLRKRQGTKRLANNYLTNARHNLIVAKSLISVSENQKIKDLLVVPNDFQTYSWIISISYYAMYHAALSALAKEDYESDDHAATRYALAKLYVIKSKLEQEALEIFDQSKKLLEEEYVITLDNARKNDQVARYSSNSEYEKNKAEEQFKIAQQFVQRMAELVEE